VATMKEVRLPDIGDFSDVEIIEIPVSPGDRVAVEDPILTLESDKASMDIPAPFAGVVKEIEVKVGDRVSQGDLLMHLEVEAEAEAGPSAGAPPESAAGETAPPEAEPAPRPAPRLPGEKPPAPPPVPQARAPSGRKPHASPAVRRFARELGADLSQVQGSGPKGRILKADVQAYIQRALAGEGRPPAAAGGLQVPPLPEVDFARFGETESQPLSRIKRLSGAHLHRSWLNIPHVTQFDEADISELEAFRKAHKAEADGDGVRLTFMPFLMRACAAALKAMPQVNASLAPDGENLILKRYVHIGVAVDTPNGLLVPVIRDVDRKGIFDLARELMTLSAKAREGKLAPDDMQGGSFTISSLGGIGGTAFTPVVNAPEVAILGVSRATMKPVWDGESFQPRLMLPLSLSYDHRVIDGAEGVRFTTLLTRLLSDIRRLLL